MPQLILLRHAHALPVEQGKRDIARQLSERGRQEAAAAGAWLAQYHPSLDYVLCSPAQRTRRTAERVLSALRDPPNLHLAAEIYDATATQLLALLADEHFHKGAVLLVGHNPGLTSLLRLLVEGGMPSPRVMPTASLALLELSGALKPGGARISAFWTPPSGD